MLEIIPNKNMGFVFNQLLCILDKIISLGKKYGMQLDTEPRDIKGEFPILEKTQSHQPENLNTQHNTLRGGEVEAKNVKLQLDLVADTTGAIHSGNLMNSGNQGIQENKVAQNNVKISFRSQSIKVTVITFKTNVLDCL